MQNENRKLDQRQLRRKRKNWKEVWKKRIKQLTLIDLLKGKKEKCMSQTNKRVERWRQISGENGEERRDKMDMNEEEISMETKRIEDILEKHEQEKNCREKRIEEWKEREKKLAEEGRTKQEESDRRNSKRKLRVENKSQLEESSKIMRK